MLKEMMEKEANLALTMDIIEEVLGKRLEVKCIVASFEENSIPENINIEKDGMVSMATRDLGGKISSVKEDKPPSN